MLQMNDQQETYLIISWSKQINHALHFFLHPDYNMFNWNHLKYLEFKFTSGLKLFLEVIN